MEVSSGRSVWMIPPQFALWIPSGTFHQIRMNGVVRMRTLYFRPRAVLRGSPPECSVLCVTQLLRELIVEAGRLGRLHRRYSYDCALRDLLIFQLSSATSIPTVVTMPTETRAQSVAQLIVHNPAESKPLAALCAEQGVSVRTVQRIFRREVGCDMDSWRRQVRLNRAVQLLVAGYSVKEVAFSVGFRQSSAFVGAFSRLFGSTPKAWTASLRSAPQVSAELIDH
jgi:AraC-like DNA-binding protein